MPKYLRSTTSYRATRCATMVLLALAALVVASCDEDDRRPPPNNQDFQVLDLSDMEDPDTTTETDAADVEDDMADGDATEGDADAEEMDVVPPAPTVTIISPTQPGDLRSESILTGNRLDVECQVEPVAGGLPLDTENIQIEMVDPDGNTLFETARQGQVSDVYVADFDLTNVSNGELALRCIATELGGDNPQSAEDTLLTYVDHGPTITVTNPVQMGAYSRQLSVLFRVDPSPVSASDTMADVDLGSVRAFVGNTELTALAQDMQGNWVVTFDFDDPALFAPPLTGDALLRVEAGNIRQGTPVDRVEEVEFNADNTGALITFVNPVAGDLVGGLFDIEVEVTDPAGIDADSVQVTVAGAINRTLTPRGPDRWGAQIDARTLNPNIVNALIEVSANDLAGNTANNGIAVTLDIREPLVDLDPPHVREFNNDSECSTAFDPIGRDTPDDLAIVPQLTEIRARIEDQGNGALSTGVVNPKAGVALPTVRVYVLDNTTGALIVDTDGDGACDEINPNLSEGATAVGPDGVAVRDMVAVDPTGGSYFWRFSGILIAADETRTRCLGAACSDAEFACTSDGACIAAGAVCDGTPDCTDGSDEDAQRCTQGGRCDPQSEFACTFGGCIPIADRCNGTEDCQFGEDELTPCDDVDFDPLTEFRCEDGQDIPLSQVCDGTTHCLLGADEKSSLCGVCLPTEERCPSGICVPAAQVCDGVPHCAGDLPYDSPVAFIGGDLGCNIGNTSTNPPDPICPVSSPLVRVIHDEIDNTPVIYGLGPVNDSSCVGSGFDFLGAAVSEGWACVAIRSEDNLGNIGISKPMRYCVDLDGDGAPCAGPAPDCTGSYDPNTAIDDPAADCTLPDGFREHPWRNLRRN